MIRYVIVFAVFVCGCATLHAPAEKTAYPYVYAPWQPAWVGLPNTCMPAQNTNMDDAHYLWRCIPH